MLCLLLSQVFLALLYALHLSPSCGPALQDRVQSLAHRALQRPERGPWFRECADSIEFEHYHRLLRRCRRVGWIDDSDEYLLGA